MTMLEDGSSPLANTPSLIEGNLLLLEIVVHAGAGRFSCICRVYGPMSSETRLQPTLSLQHGPEVVKACLNINQMVLSGGFEFNICEL